MPEWRNAVGNYRGQHLRQSTTTQILCLRRLAFAPQSSIPLPAARDNALNAAPGLEEFCSAAKSSRPEAQDQNLSARISKLSVFHGE